MDNKIITGGQICGSGLLVWLSQLDPASWSYIIGIGGVLVGTVFGLFWQYRRDKRERLIFEATLESLKSKGVTLNDEHVVD